MDNSTQDPRLPLPPSGRGPVPVPLVGGAPGTGLGVSSFQPTPSGTPFGGVSGAAAMPPVGVGQAPGVTSGQGAATPNASAFSSLAPPVGQGAVHQAMVPQNVNSAGSAQGRNQFPTKEQQQRERMKQRSRGSVGYGQREAMGAGNSNPLPGQGGAFG